MRAMPLLLVFALLLAGCQPAVPTPAATPTTVPVAAANTPTALPPTAAPAVTALPTSTPLPTSLATAAATVASPATPTPAPTRPAATPTVAALPSTPTPVATARPALTPTSGRPAGLERVTLVIAPAGRPEVAVSAEVANDDRERQYGLMMRTSLPEGEGMLFIFPAELQAGFWMENTLVPLSIAFITGDGTIIGLDDMAPQTRDTHAPSRPYRYALEVPQGFFARQGVKVGDVVRYRDGAQLRSLSELPQTAAAR